MSDKFQPVAMESLAAWVFGELESRGSIFGIPRALFFVPGAADPFSVSVYGRRLETPIGVAAGPHSQMAQNIIVAWLCGARFIELKTVQTLDELEVSKPCIDLQDEGYNVEWSQELKVLESFAEYVRAWVLIHALHRKLGFPGEAPGVLFNMSVGYNMAGLLKPNMQEYLRLIRDASALKAECVDAVAKHFPGARDVAIPSCVSDSVTLSTMHGCPPDEIEKISAYLINEWGLHTNVKLNPTLLGPQPLRRILNDTLGYRDVVVPDLAFEHDLKYADAVPMLRRLKGAAAAKKVQFGVKLSNTLEVENTRDVFSKKEKMMYLSGRPLHAITTNLAAKLAAEFEGGLMMSFSAGADAFNVANLLRCGVKTVTVCSDLLKTGGYLRLPQYLENIAAATRDIRAADLPEFIVRTARKTEGFEGRFEAALHGSMKACAGFDVGRPICKELTRLLVRAPASSQVSSVVRGWADEQAYAQHADRILECATQVCARLNLELYAQDVLKDRRLRKDAVDTSRTKTSRALGPFDCIQAPCTDECPINQKVPLYMTLVREGRYDEAVDITRDDNALPTILGRACNHLCENVCIRTHLDEPLAIREMKRFIMSRETSPRYREKQEARGVRVGVIGGGPCGLSAAYFLAQAGYAVTVFEARPYAGGMVSGTIPAYRAAQAVIDQDLAIIRNLGVEVRYDQQAGRDFTFAALRGQGFKYVVIAVGAQRGRKLGIPGEEAEGMLDALEFLRSCREHKPPKLGARVGVIGGGDVAMDCARSARRLAKAKVTLIYRRTIGEMPAAREEIHGALEEGVELIELAKPLSVVSKRGKMTGLQCLRMKLGDKDSSGRRRPVDIPGSEFVIPLDTLIAAISQEPALDFLDGEPVEKNRDGYLKVDPATMETSIAGVYAGGDIALNGPESIVKALGDGRIIAESIRRKEEGERPAPKPAAPVEVDVVDLQRRRSHREFRVPVPELPVSNRTGFDEILLTLSEEEARREASRCLDCHRICSLCVSVCPNLAFFTYRAEAFEARLPELTLRGGQVASAPGRLYRVDQPFQVAVLTDFCNECGNCATFCPTSGRPYRDKPRLYLRRSEFEAEPDNAFMVSRPNGAWRLEARFGGATHEITIGDDVVYVSPKLRAKLDAKTFEVREIVPAASWAEGETLSLNEAAAMFVLLRSVRDSAGHMPTA